MERPRLTRYELEIMDVVWKLGEATVHQVRECLTRPLAYTTVMTTLSLLESKKKVLERIKCGRAYVYRPVVTREEVSRSMLEDLRHVLFGDAFPSLVLNMLSKEDLSEADVAMLKEAIEQVENAQ